MQTHFGRYPIKSKDIPSEGRHTILVSEGLNRSVVRNSEFRGIQALRCFAALMVVVTHATDIWADHINIRPRPLTWGNGTAGVDIFFVISGFVMMISSAGLQNREHPARVFLWRRLARIVPLYWVLTTVKILTTKIRPALVMHAPPSMWNILASYLFLPSYSASGDIRPVIPVGWTLNFEMLFYVLFAVALSLRVRVTYVLIPVLGALSCAAFYRTPTAPAITAFADPIVLDFLAGVLLAFFFEKTQSIPIKAVIAAGCIGLLGILAYLPQSSVSLARAAIYGGGATVIVAAVIACEPYLAKILPGWILLLGDSSYSIYLIQSFTLPIAAALLIRGRVFDRGISSGLVEWLCIVSGTVATVLVAIPMYKHLEYPMTKALKRIKV
jgi:exopolysaccharide production protein ExoZ